MTGVQTCALPILPYLFLGHNRSYLFVNVDVVDVNRKKTDVRSMSPIDLILNCFTFDTFLLKICCFAKLDMKRKKRSTATMPFILNREYKFFIPEKKSSVLQILFNCLKCSMSHKAIPVQFFCRSGKKKWHWVCGVIFGSVLRIFSLVFQFKLSL